MALNITNIYKHLMIFSFRFAFSPKNKLVLVLFRHSTQWHCKIDSSKHNNNYLILYKMEFSTFYWENGCIALLYHHSTNILKCQWFYFMKNHKCRIYCQLTRYSKHVLHFWHRFWHHQLQLNSLYLVIMLKTTMLKHKIHKHIYASLNNQQHSEKRNVLVTKFLHILYTLFFHLKIKCIVNNNLLFYY